MFLNSSGYLIQSGMSSQNFKKIIKGFQQVGIGLVWSGLVSWRDLRSDLHNCLVFTMPANYPVRLSQRENNWRSYLQQNCSPGLNYSQPRAFCASPGGWWEVGGAVTDTSSQQPASQSGVIITSSVIVLLPSTARHTRSDSPQHSPHPSGYLQCFVLVCKARAAGREGELL